MTARDRVGMWRLSLVVALAGLILTHSGCSIIGLVTGLHHDAQRPEGGAYPGWQWVKITPGTDVTIRLTDGTKIKGTLMSVDQLSAGKYASNYADRRNSDPAVAALPAIRDSLRLALITGEEISGTLLSFDQRFDSALVVPCIRMLPREQAVSRRIDLAQIASITDAYGHPVAIDSIASLTKSKRLPLSSALLLSTQTGLTEVPFDRIDRLLFQGGFGAVEGFFGGLLIDAVVAVIVVGIYNSIHVDFAPKNDSSSCPYVYCFDGKRYVSDAELFAGAIFQKAERTDWTRLDHLATVHGEYRLKITNEREETEYVDELTLLAVDHPSGTEVVPTFDGSLCLLVRPEPPSVATDFAGSNVLDLVSSVDDQTWTSNPFGRNPDDSSQLRDGLDLTFPRPHDADSMTLALNVRNTSWGAYLQNQFVRLLGKDAPAWYDTLNNSPAAREALRRTMLREGMLQVRLWNGNAWQSAGYVWEVGPAVAKDVALPLDLREIPGDSLCVRLESTAGLWTINSVRADYWSGVATQVLKLLPREAKDSHGRDLRQTLQQTDANYYEMPTTSDWAELTFVSPVVEPGQERSFILRSAGYYSIHTPAMGEPQTELVKQMMTEPGAFGRYSLRLLNGYVKDALVLSEHKSSP